MYYLSNNFLKPSEWDVRGAQGANFTDRWFMTIFDNGASRSCSTASDYAKVVTIST